MLQFQKYDKIKILDKKNQKIKCFFFNKIIFRQN